MTARKRHKTTLDLFSAPPPSHHHDHRQTGGGGIPPTIVEFFAGFDDHMKAKEPGYKARRAQERAERERQWAEYRIAVIEKYGSEDAVKAPTPIEQAIETAAEPLRRDVCTKFGAVESLDGWNSVLSIDKAPDRVRRAVEQAWPMPVTVLAAKIEYDLWNERENELAAAWGADSAGGEYLSLACDFRRAIVLELLETGLRAQSIGEVLIRQRHYLARDFDMPEVAQAVIADLEHLALRGL